MEKSWFGDAIRAIIAQLDKVVYGLISIFYDIILKLAEINVFKEGAVEDTATRLYTLIGLFMLFKVSFSFINYIINPDSLNDKEKGGGNLLKHIIISFVMIIITPFCFNFLTEAQSAILTDQIIPNFILGTNWKEGSGNTFKISEECPNKVQITDSGDYIALMAISPFYQLETETGFDQAKKEEVISSTNYCSATKVKELLSGDIYKAGKKDGLYTVNYSIFISTVVGVIVALLFLNFCMDVAVRAIKLGFLEIISPIPIISYIDPSKSASSMFKKWLSEVGRTWASLFIRLISVFFAIFIISNINYDTITEDNSWYISLFIIIGALIFAKQLPKLIENILGIKLDGGFQLNPLKKVSNQALGGKLLTGAAVAGGGLALGALAQGTSNVVNFGRSRHNLNKQINDLAGSTRPEDIEKRNKLQSQLNNMGARRLFATTVGGLGGGAMRGLQSGYSTGQKGSANVFKNVKSDLQKGNTARNNREAIRNYNAEVERTGTGEKYGWFERNVTENLDKAFGVKNDEAGYGYYDKKISELERKISDNNDKESAIRTGISNYCTNNGVDQFLVEELHKMTKGNASNASDMIAAINSLSTESKTEFLNTYNLNNLSTADFNSKIQSIYSTYDSNLRSSFNNVDRINASTKEMKAQKKQYSEIANTKKSIGNKK